MPETVVILKVHSVWSDCEPLCPASSIHAHMNVIPGRNDEANSRAPHEWE